MKPWDRMIAAQRRKREPVTPDLGALVSAMTVAQVLAAVDAGELEVDEAIVAEQAGRARVTLLSALRDR